MAAATKVSLLAVGASIPVTMEVVLLAACVCLPVAGGGGGGRRSRLLGPVRSSSSSSGFRIGRRSDSSGGRSPLPRASALDGSSDEGVVIGSRRELFSGSAARAAH